MNEKVLCRFQFDINVFRDLRHAINDKRNLSIAKEGKDQKKHTYPAWDKMCVIMDRLDDTADYLSSMTLGSCKSKRSAFDFYEFLNCSYTLIECIKSISMIFSSNAFKIIEESQEVFGDVMNAGGTDSLFFGYARSLFSVHPVCTDRQYYPYIKRTGSTFHCCPFVMWSHNSHLVSDDNKSDLVAVIYTSKTDEHQIKLPLFIDQFYRYVKKWIDYVPNVIKIIQDYNEQKYNEYRKIEVKDIDAFEHESKYIAYLRDEYEKRFGNDFEDVFNSFILIFENELTSKRNQNVLEKYRNAIRYSLPFLRNSLQNMSFDGFENNGMSHSEYWSETALFFELDNCTCLSGDLQKYSYDLSKSYYLRPDMGYHQFDQIYARNLIIDIREDLSRFVDISGNETNLELYIITRLVEYQNALNEKTLLNKNIPNEAQYRVKLLSLEEQERLFLEDKMDNNPELANALKEFLNNNS